MNTNQMPFLKLQATTKFYFVASEYVSLGMVLLLVFLLQVFTFVPCTVFEGNITTGQVVTV
jgi:hypothetical protein